MRAAARGPVRVRRVLAATACAALLTGCGTDLPIPGFGPDEVDGSAALTSWRDWEPPETEKHVDFSDGPWDRDGRLRRDPDVCGLLSKEAVRQIVPETTDVSFRQQPGDLSGAAAGEGTCTVVIASDVIPEGAGQYLFAVDALVAKPQVVRRAFASARDAAMSGTNAKDYGSALGGGGAWAGGHRLVLLASDSVLVEMRSIGRTNGVGWTVPTSEFDNTSTAELEQRWRQAVFTRVAKVVTERLATR